MKKIIWSLIVLIAAFHSGFGADTYESILEKMAAGLASRLQQQGHPAVAVYPFYEKGNKITEFSRVVSEDFAIHLGQHKGFKIIDRNYLEQMMEEHRLNAEGLIDPRTAKKFGMIIAADYYITGKIHILRYSFRLSVFAINTQTGEQIWARSRYLPLDADLAMLAGIKDWKERSRILQKEQETGQAGCEKNQTGDVCFINKRIFVFTVEVFDSNGKSWGKFTVQPGDEGCIYDLPAGKVFHYKARKLETFIGERLPEGMFRVVICKTKHIRF